MKKKSYRCSTNGGIPANEFKSRKACKLENKLATHLKLFNTQHEFKAKGSVSFETLYLKMNSGMELWGERVSRATNLTDYNNQWCYMIVHEIRTCKIYLVFCNSWKLDSN